MNQHPLAADLETILEHTRELWEELRGERIFITGGTGFFGKWLLESLLWANERLALGAQAMVLTRSVKAFNIHCPHLAQHAAITMVEGDVRNFSFPGGAFPFIIHAATESSAKLNQEAPLQMLDTIVEGTRHTLDFAQNCGARKFLYLSSGAVYGKQPPEMAHIPEEYAGAPDPMDPGSAYGQGKRMAEHLCRQYAGDALEIKIARGFAFVGPYLPLDAHFAVGNFIRDALNGGPIVIKGDGTTRRSYLYAGDLATWLWTILFRGQSCRPYNVGSDEAFSLREVAKVVSTCFSQTIRIEILGNQNPKQGAESYIPCIKRARHELGVQVNTQLHDSIYRTITFHRITRDFAP